MYDTVKGKKDDIEKFIFLMNVLLKFVHVGWRTTKKKNINLGHLGKIGLLFQSPSFNHLQQRVKNK